MDEQIAIYATMAFNILSDYKKIKSELVLSDNLRQLRGIIMGRKWYFDSYRGIGACIICLYHFINTFGLQGCVGSRFYGVLENIQIIGYLPVEFFFFSSGYFIFQFYYSKINSGEIDFLMFMKKRIKKIYPLFFVSTLIQIFLDIATGKSVTLFDAIINFLLLGCGFFNANDSWRSDINGVTWFIVPLLFSYCIFYFISKYVKDEKHFCFAVLALALSSTVLYNWGGLNAPIFNAYILRGVMGFSIGIFFKVLVDKYKDYIKWPIVILGVVLFSIYLWEADNYVYGAQQLITMTDLIAVPSIIIFTEYVFPFKKIMEIGILRWLGCISMEIYFFHWPMMTIMTFLIEKESITSLQYLFLLGLMIVIAIIIKGIIKCFNIIKGTKFRKVI